MRKLKVAARSFTEHDLPSNRTEVFWDIFKLRFRTLIGIGLCLLVFLLPLFACLILKDGMFLSIQEENPSDADYYSIRFVFALVEIVFFPIAGLGFAGAFRIIRNLVWEEPIFFKDDFFDGIKKNGKQYALVFFLAGLIIFINTFMGGIQDIPQLVSYIPSCISIVYFLPVGLFALSIINVYNVTMKQCITIASQLFVKYLLKNIVAILATCVCGFVLLLPYIVIKYFALIIIIIVVLPCIIMGWFLYNCYLFDNAINKEQYPEIYDKGIHRKEVIALENVNNNSAQIVNNSNETDGKDA